ncbi:MAG: lysophospholipid acyltransferase family protein [bacterium]
MRVWIEYIGVRLFGGLVAILPRRVSGAMGAALGALVYTLGIRRRVTQENLRAAFPSLPPRAIRQVACATYRHFGRVGVSFAWLPRVSSHALDRWIFVKDLQIFDEALRKGKGAIFVSGHLGNWELMGAIIAALGYPVTYVVTTQRNKRVEALMDRLRESAGAQIVKVREGVRGVLSALKQNRLVAILIDQDAHEAGAFVPFFGHPASTPKGAAIFHLKTGSPLIFARSLRISRERYVIHLEKLDTTALEPRDAETITALATRELEKAIRENPEQWFWMHRRWKTRPPDCS